jgi:hypothetical protein
LLDALEKDAEFLRNEIKPCICLEIGLVKLVKRKKEIFL